MKYPLNRKMRLTPRERAALSASDRYEAKVRADLERTLTYKPSPASVAEAARIEIRNKYIKALSGLPVCR
jgi:hypothetical protein